MVRAAITALMGTTLSRMIQKTAATVDHLRVERDANSILPRDSMFEEQEELSASIVEALTRVKDVILILQGFTISLGTRRIQALLQALI